MRIGLVVPHIFMHEGILPRVIFSPGRLALSLADGLMAAGHEVVLFTPGPVATTARNITADLAYFESELAGRGDDYLDLLKKHPLTFVTLARQVQSEIVARAYAMANAGELDIVHIYTNEEDIALPFAALCRRPVVFTHHDPFNFLVKYKNVFRKYAQLNWLSLSLAQRRGMPAGTKWAGNIYHGIDKAAFSANLQPMGGYVAYLGRIIEPKAVHLAIGAVREHNARTGEQLRLKIAGKHYAGMKKNDYWLTRIEPELDETIEYAGFIDDTAGKQAFLGNAQALIVPSVFEEPFGMVMIEALACGTPVIGLDSGAIPEVIDDGRTGRVVHKALATDGSLDESSAVLGLAGALAGIGVIDRAACRAVFEKRFTLDQMVGGHIEAYEAAMGRHK